MFSMSEVKHGLLYKTTCISTESNTLDRMEDVSDRIKLLRKDLRLTQEGLGKVAGVTKQAVSAWERGLSVPERDALLMMQETRGVNPNWVKSGDPPMRSTPLSAHAITSSTMTADLTTLPSEGNVEAAPTLSPYKPVPVVGTVEGGPDGYLDELGYPVGHGDGYVQHPAKGRSAYALRVRGESMHPRIRSGEFIVVEPEAAINPGDDVVVICRDGRKMVKQLLYQRDGEITLGSINNGFKPITLLIEEVEAMHYVAGILPRGAFCK